MRLDLSRRLLIEAIRHLDPYVGLGQLESYERALAERLREWAERLSKGWHEQDWQRVVEVAAEMRKAAK